MSKQFYGKTIYILKKKEMYGIQCIQNQLFVVVVLLSSCHVLFILYLR